MNKTLPRGLRNNNPLNIRKSKDKWVGLSAKQTDKSFFQFQSLAFGFRAAFVLIHNYMQKYRLTNITQIICRWAPPNENNTAAYVAKVCEMSGLTSVQPLSFWNRDHMIPLVRAMAYVENGCIIEGSSIREGYRLAGGE